MNHSINFRRPWLGLVGSLLLLGMGCQQESAGQKREQPAQSPAEARPAPGQDKPPEPAKPPKELGPNVFLGVNGERRWVEIHATVCLTQGYLEHLLSRDQASKFHESVLSSQFDAGHIHAALLATGAKPGRPVQYLNANGDKDFKPPSGDPIKVTVRYQNEKGQTIEMPARRWIRNAKTKKELEHDWVFAGSRLFQNPEGPDKPPLYGANDGRVICTTNFTTALLDLPIQSQDADPQAGVDWEANTELIPPRGTKVIVILEPIVKKK